MKLLEQKFAITRVAVITSLVLTMSGCLHDDDDPVETPANTAPTISSSATTTIEEETAYSYSIVAADADGDTLTLSATTIPAWLTFDAASGALTGTPTTNDVGDHAITLAVSDGTDVTTQSFTVTVTAIVVANTPPAITSTGATSATVGTNYSYQFTATDVDGDTLEMSSVTLPTWGAFDTTTGILSGTPDMAGDYPVELMVSDGTDATNQAFTIAVTEATAMTVELVVFENAALPGWAAWINDGGSTEVVTDDVDHDQATKFVLTAPSVAGFTARDGDGAVSGATFNASGLTNGMISFELKMLKAPTAGVVDWKLKVEAGGGTTNAEVNISTAVEGHATPVLGTWQTYTFPIATLGGNLDTSAIDLFMVFPNYNDAPGAEFLLDNVMIVNDPSGGNSGGNLGPELLANGDFENGLTGWRDDQGAVVADGTNNIFEANIETLPSNVFDVNQSQVIAIAEGNTYTVSFKAKASKARTMLAGIGLNQDPWTNTTQEPALTTEWQDFSYDIVANFGNANSRVLFDMGGDTGIINLDDVSVKLKSAGAGGGSGGAGGGSGGGEPSGDAPITFEANGVGTGYTWTVFENDDNPALEIVANPDATGANTSAMVAKFTARQAGNPWAGTESAHGDFGPFTLDATNSTIKIMVYKSVISDVGIKFAISNGGAQGEIKMANTLVNQWEELTFDFSGNIGKVESTNIDQIIVFPDFNLDGRSADTVSYFDNITFSN